MYKKVILFDMDGVLLAPHGYHRALRDSVRRFGLAMGIPNAMITEEQIARFETAHITNEWDTLAICVAINLVHAWQFDPSVRLDGIKPREITLTQEIPDLDQFLDHLSDGGNEPAKIAFALIGKLFAWLNPYQLSHLRLLLEHCRDIEQSPTLPSHQETVLGSLLFQEVYGLEPKLNIESFLLKYDRPLMTDQQYSSLINWLKAPNHHAGIMTNRPSSSPPGYLSAPEAELGIRLIGLDHLPYVGSGFLAWYAIMHTDFPDHTLLKPNPVHALAVLQQCLGTPPVDALHKAVALWQGRKDPDDWEELHGAKITLLEDSTKGIIAGMRACELLSYIGIEIDLRLIGISENIIKSNALEQFTHQNIANINQISWETLFL